MQHFKGDETEIKMYDSGAAILSLISLQLDLMLEGCESAQPLGDIIYEDETAPLTNAIIQTIFRESFPELFESFVVAGSFESYIAVFAKIFGDDVVVEFTVPAPGKLNIEITATGLELSPFVSRYVEDNDYVFDYVIDDEDDNIVFQTVKGFESEYELELMLHEMVPAGIFTEITLTV